MVEIYDISFVLYLSFKPKIIKMKHLLIIITISSFFLSCSSEEDIIKEVIQNTNHSSYSTKKVGELSIIKDDIYSLSIHSSRVVKLFPDRGELIDVKSDYKMVRYIYKTPKKVFRMFYLIDITKKKLFKKSSDFNDFFEPLCKTIFGENYELKSFRGDLKFELMR